jgi:hypothetical protein
MTASRDELWVDMTQFDPRLADRVWEGDLRDPDAPRWYTDVAAAIRRARGPAEPGELIDEPVVVANMSGAALGRRVTVRPHRQRSHALHRIVAIKATATVASLTMVGVAAATTGLVAGVVVPAINEHIAPLVEEHLDPGVTVPGGGSAPPAPLSMCADRGVPCGDRVPLPAVDAPSAAPPPAQPTPPPTSAPGAATVPEPAVEPEPAAPDSAPALTDDLAPSPLVEAAPTAPAPTSPAADPMVATAPLPVPVAPTTGAPAPLPRPDLPPTAHTTSTPDLSSEQPSSNVSAPAPPGPMEHSPEVTDPAASRPEVEAGAPRDPGPAVAPDTTSGAADVGGPTEVSNHPGTPMRNGPGNGPAAASGR